MRAMPWRLLRTMGQADGLSALPPLSLFSPPRFPGSEAIFLTSGKKFQSRETTCFTRKIVLKVKNLLKTDRVFK